MILTILSPNKKIFEGEVLTSKFPGSSGQFQVLTNHAPLVSTLKTGLITYIDNSHKNYELKIKSGFVEVLDNKVMVLVEEVL